MGFLGNLFRKKTKEKKPSPSISSTPAVEEAEEAPLPDVFAPLGAKDYVEVQRLIGINPALVDSRDKSGATPLHYAARAGQIQLIKSLLAAGASPNAKDNNGETPLHLAASDGGKGDAVSALIDALPDPAGFDPGAKATRRAYREGARHVEEVIKQLVLGGADMETAGGELDRTPLHDALDYQREAGPAARLVALGASVQSRDKRGLTPLHIAAGESADKTRLLLSHGADVDAQNRSHETPLHDAAAYGQAAAAKLLLDRGANVNAKNDAGATPLEMAGRMGYEDAFHEISSRGGHR